MTVILVRKKNAKALIIFKIIDKIVKEIYDLTVMRNRSVVKTG